MIRLAVTFGALVVVVMFLIVVRFRALEARVQELEEGRYVQVP